MVLLITRMLVLFVLVTCFLGEGFSLTENGWRDAALTFYGKMTKYLHEQRYDKYGEMLVDDVVLLYPGMKISGKNGLVQAERIFSKGESVKQEYVSFVELMYATPEVAVVRHGGYEDMRDGSHKLSKGLMLFVAGERGVKVKVDIFSLN